MSKIIAVVRLAPGHVAFFDEITRTHLTIGNPLAEIQDYMNFDGIKRAVANKTLTLVHGGFTETAEVVEDETHMEIKVSTPTPSVELPKVEVIEKEIETITEQVETDPKDEIVAEVTEVQIETEVITELTAEEVAEEEPKAKITRKKK